MPRRVRPKFTLTTPEREGELLARIGRRLKGPDAAVSGLVAPGRIELHVHGREQHLWSPQLVADVVDSPEGARLECRFGPHPSVWTMYAAGYAACAFGAFVGAMFAYAEWVMGEPPWALLSLPTALLVAIMLYGLALLGQRLGDEQMDQLRRFLESSLTG